ncbi:MAG: hypothetical protein JSW39_22800 [Desulfobacterales bacterium]|nr:MAG: hypothetical protein JSW39_22800 [Desulfobacterales bacterium]
MEKFWLPLTLIIIALLTSIFGIIKDVLPKLFPSWLMYITVGITAVGALLQFYQDYQGLQAQNKVTELSSGIEPVADAPKKALTPNDQRIYAAVKKDVKRFREAPVKLFLAPSIGADTFYKLALVQFNQQNFADAEVNLTYALKLDSEHKDSYNLLLQLYQTEAMHLLQKGDYQGAEKRLVKADHLLGNMPQGIDNRTVALIGYVYKSLGQVYQKSDADRAARYWKQAKQVFKSALTINDEDPNALNGLGNILYFQDQYLDALARHKEALERAPNYTAAANDAALVCEALMCQSFTQQKDSDADKWRLEAITFWEKAIQLCRSDPLFEPTYPSSVGRRVEILSEGRPSEICK